MTKQIYDRFPKKGKLSLQPSSKQPMPPLSDEPKVIFVLVDSTVLHAKLGDLEEDEDCIYGTLLGGKAFAVPINNVLYCVEG